MTAFDEERAHLNAALKRSPSIQPGSATMAKCNNLPLIKVGLVGCGDWGAHLASQFQQLGDAQLSTLCDLCSDRLIPMGKAYPEAHLTQNFKELLTSDIDAIAIATPVHSHYLLVQQALEAGKHVLVEMPLAANLEDAQALTSLAQQCKRILMVGQTFQYSPAIQKVRDIVASSELGPIQYIDSVRVNLGLLRPDVNVMWDLALHDISIINYILGVSALQVSATGKACTLPELGLHDVAMLTLQYPQKLLVTIRVSWLEPVERRTLIIVGGDKTLVYDEAAEFAVSVYDSNVRLGAVSQPLNEAEDWPVNYRRGNKKSYALPNTAPLTQLSQDFLNDIAQHHLGQCPRSRSSSQMGLAAVQVLEAAQNSLEADGVFVNVKTQAIANQIFTGIEPENFPTSTAKTESSRSEPLPPQETSSMESQSQEPRSQGSLSPDDRAANLSALIGIVIVGQNKGDRLHRALCSALSDNHTVVYVDSGSTDGSVPLAKSLGVEVVELSPQEACTPASAYNRGIERLQSVAPSAEFVQCLDGDCELMAGWLDSAFAEMERDSSIAVIYGRRREEFRTRNVFHRLVDMEWNTRLGELSEYGVEGLMRLSRFSQVGGFDDRLIMGKELELCLRLRRAGVKIRRIDADVSLHDIQMSRLSQWWQRTLRNGYSRAESVWRYGTAERYSIKQSLSIWFWALVIPSLAIAAAIPTQGSSLVSLVSLYAFQTYRVARYRNLAHGDAILDSWLYGLFCIFGKVPELQGQIEFWLRLALGRQRDIVEYKQPINP